MNLFGVMEVSGSALKAERVRAEVVAANMANAETTRTASGGAYQRQHVVFQSVDPSQSFGAQFSLAASGLNNGVDDAQTVAGGVRVSAVIRDQGQGLKRYDPNHPDADKDGYVTYPDINPLTEMVDLMGATRAYDLNDSAIQATKSMLTASLDILK
jgi:flagellar basal-body rod protein FlgC